MTTLTLKRKIIKRIEKLPKKELEIIGDIIVSRCDPGDEEATKELLAIAGFEKRLKKAENEISEGKVHSFKKIRKHV